MLTMILILMTQGLLMTLLGIGLGLSPMLAVIKLSLILTEIELIEIGLLISKAAGLLQEMIVLLIELLLLTIIGMFETTAISRNVELISSQVRNKYKLHLREPKQEESVRL